MPAKERRKVITVGPSRAVTLPKPFVDYNKFADGEEVEVLYDSLVLIVPKGALDKLKEKEDLIHQLLK